MGVLPVASPGVVSPRRARSSLVAMIAAGPPCAPVAAADPAVRAAILDEALPYLRRYSGRLAVVQRLERRTIGLADRVPPDLQGRRQLRVFQGKRLGGDREPPHPLGRG